MVDLIFSYIIKAIVVLVCCFLYIFLISKLLPGLFLTSKRKSAEPRDRGIKKYVFDKGRAIVYVPEPNTKKYINQYILSENDGERFLKCKFDNRVVTAYYDVTVFNSSDKVIDTIEVHDTPDHGRSAHAVPLPLSAAYVNISVNEINSVKVSNSKKDSVSLISYLLYVTLTFASTAAMSLIINAAAIHIADLCLRFTEKMGKQSLALPIVTALIFSVIYTAVTIKKHRIHD